ncbi:MULTISPECIES: alanine/glycine:cation symporter family protein [unclassified Sedimentibacter]|uniref:alanine/glycine:cation symporter family protein n=1 Tax=unclassified Sedimentibacter TaxID=2649220 RepID=UPI0027E0FE02|nr:sodium:alanine symporter family protein [Sedimentibacter sp. MB35-C1]WMJ78201.1 sodium:alanine symporter family protein [Sedimentibacter sp. MB35-C1]
MSFTEIIVSISNWIWGLPMLLLLAGGGIFLTFRLGFFQFRHLWYMWGQTFGKMLKKPEDKNAISPFQAATAALASTIGASNIVGVPVAIAFGGPGAVFWMWIIALIGNASKFSEIVLGIKYREKNAAGEFVGGPTYYLSKGLKNKALGKFLAFLFAFFLFLELIPSIATQAISAVQTLGSIGVPSMVTGVGMAVIVFIVVFGGIKRITQVTEKLVPIMAIVYLLGALIIIISNITAVPHVFGLIIKGAFAPSAATGGFAGSSVALALRWGAARGTYSNEAGMGTAPIAHATAETDHPVRQGFWGIFEITVDTLLVCTLTAFVVLLSGVWTDIPSSEAASMPAIAFINQFGSIGGYVVSISIFLFVLSTVIVLVFYGEKQAEYLFGTKFATKWKYVYVLSIILGVVGGIEFLYSFIDLFLALIIFPNVIGLIAMSGEVVELKNEFFTSEQYYLKDKKRVKQR